MDRLPIYVALLAASIALTLLLLEYEAQKPTANDRYFSLGTVLSTSAKIWVYSPECSEFEISWRQERGSRWFVLPVQDVGEGSDWTHVAELKDLAPRTRYVYFVRWNRLLQGQRQLVTMKTFTTLAESGETGVFSFVFSSCWMIFPMLPPLILEEWKSEDFAIFLGDSHYSDLVKLPQQQLYRYMLKSQQFRNLTSRMSLFSMYDDHELENNYDSGNETKLYHESMRLWKRYLGSRNPDPLVPWGHFYSFDSGDVGIFVMDTRGHRSRMNDTSESKSILGPDQKRLFLNWLHDDHRLKIVASPVPWTLAAESPADGWAMYPHEREELLDAMEGQPAPIILLSGDMHWAGSFEIRPKIFEFSASPLHAFPFYAPTPSDGTIFSSGMGLHYGRISVNTGKRKPSVQVDLYKKTIGDSTWVSSHTWNLTDLARPSPDWISFFNDRPNFRNEDEPCASASPSENSCVL